jgi:streptomycin 6-kinase
MWRVSIERAIETETWLLAFGSRGRDSVVLKVQKQSGDEWNSGEVLAAFHGKGIVRVHDYGDLHHYNVVFDSVRGWVAIDPKAVIDEVEYEIGAALRNPIETRELVNSPEYVRRRLERFSEMLDLDFGRTLRWAFAQAVLSAVWSIEDGLTLRPADPALRLAETIQAMLGRS